MSKIPNWVRAVQKNRKWFTAAKTILEMISQARDGGRVSRGLAAFSAFGTLLESVYPSENVWYKIQSLDLNSTDYVVGGFLCDILRRSNVPVDLISAGPESQVWAWNDSKGTPYAAAVYRGNQFGDGPYIREGMEGRFFDQVREAVWSLSTSLQVAVTREKDSWKCSDRFRLEDSGPLGRYIGVKSPEYYADRISKYPPGPRTIIFGGPTGVGKSVLARHISKCLGKSHSRTLKISSEALQSVGFEELLGLVRALQPTVLLLDDLDLRSSANTERFLSMLEALRDPNCLVIITVMTTSNWEPKDSKPGSWHFPGMRPDRVDEIFVLGLPDSDERRDILGLYYTEVFGVVVPPGISEKIVARTSGLSGAYLLEVARRIHTHGVESWKSEVDSILMMAPGQGSETTSDPLPQPTKKGKRPLTPPKPW